MSKRSRQARRMQRAHERHLYFLEELRAAARRYIAESIARSRDLAILNGEKSAGMMIGEAIAGGLEPVLNEWLERLDHELVNGCEAPGTPEPRGIMGGR